MIPIYLINLDRSSDRLARMAGQLEQLGLSFKRVQAFDGNSMTADNRATWIAARTANPAHKWLSGQIGCLESHLAVWDLIAKGPDRCSIVMEDDVHLSKAFGSFCADDAWVPANADIVRFETTLTGMRLGAQTAAGMASRHLRRILDRTHSAGGYLIRQEIAALLARTPPSLQIPPDYLMFDPKRSFVAGHLRVFQMSPACVVQDKNVKVPEDKFGFDSLIDPDYDGYYKHRSNLFRVWATPILRKVLRREVVRFV